jgi:hypothetical protein
MDTFLYILISSCVFGSIFLFGWQFGCWMVQRENMKKNHDCYTDKFYENYYSQYDGSCGEDKHLYDKPAKKKSTKKGNK